MHSKGRNREHCGHILYLERNRRICVALHQIELSIGAGLALAGAGAPSDALQGQFKLFQPINLFRAAGASKLIQLQMKMVHPQCILKQAHG